MTGSVPTGRTIMIEAAKNEGVPLGVLYAVGMTETGKKGSLHPYALNIEGDTVFASSPREALAHFAKARKAGAKLIDLGWHLLPGRGNARAIRGVDDRYRGSALGRFAEALFCRCLFPAIGGIEARRHQVPHDAGDAAGARELALRWLAFLEEEAARAPNVEARAAFDPHRVNAALAAGAPLRTVAALQQSERDLPADYNAPARLALLYREAGQLDDALAAIDRALARVYGPRTIRLLETKARIQSAKGDAASARGTLEAALKTAEALPAAQHRDEIVARLRGQLTQKN